MKASIRDYGTADHTTHDLAIARAERDAWQSTCEELHRTIAGRDVEIEAHLGRCEAADQRARSLEAGLTAEREASKGLVAQVEALRTESKHYTAIANHNAEIEAQNATLASERDAAIAERDACAYDLRAIRDLVAPGNPQGTVVDAVRARLDAVENAQAFGIRERDAAIARAEKAEADLRIMSRARDNATKAVHTLSGLYDDSKAELAKLRAELAELTVTHDRLLAREHEDGRLHAQLRAELAELRARPVLTEDLLRGALDAHGYAGLTRKLFAHLGPVTLPSPDRAEELVSAWRGICTDSATCDLDPAERMRRALASLGAPPTSPPAARPVFAGVSEDELIRLFYVVGTDGIDHGEQCPPIDISDRNGIRAVLARLEVSLVTPVAPTLVAVSDEELAVAFYSEPERPALRECIDAADLAGIRAVRAKLGAAEVTADALTNGWIEATGFTAPEVLKDAEVVRAKMAHAIVLAVRATAAKGG